MAKRGGEGLRGPDKQQASLRDERGGAYESGDKPPLKDGSKNTGHQRAQQGADVRERAEKTPPADADTPEGLRRPRKGPYDKRLGRNEATPQVPKDRRGDAG